MFSTKETYSIIKSKSKNTYGYDEISTEILKIIYNYITSPLTHIYNKINLSGYYSCFFESFRFSYSWSAASENCKIWRGFYGSCMHKGIPCRSHAESQGMSTIARSQNDVRCTARKSTRSSSVHSIRK
jgi:hypothetical protein